MVLLAALAACAERAPILGSPTAPEAPSAPPAATPTPTPATSRPNLLVILSDDHRWDALGAAGNPAIVTPELDRLAHEGVYFRQAIVSVSQCHPSRASLLTGLPSFRHGLFSIQEHAADLATTLCARPTVASLLRDVGYRTVVVGKWHIPPVPWTCGFEDVRTWLPDGNADYRDPELVRGRSEQRQKVAGYTQEIFADDAVGFLRSDAAQRGPFLLWLAFTAPHFPYEPNPERIAALYAERGPEQLLPPRFPRDAEANDWRHYDEAVSYLDEQVGRVLAALRESGLSERTVVVFLGDNGYMMGEHGVGGPGSRANGKQVPYEASLRVPFLMAGPGLPRAVASDLPVSSLDLPTTLLALAGSAAPRSWPGRDLTAALAGRIAIDDAVAEWSDEASEKFGDLAYRVLRTPTHKLIVWKDAQRGIGGEELYDLVADPNESRNLVGESADGAVLRDLRARLAVWMRRHEDPALQWRAGLDR
ncbi:MAG TPA: sulfatase-like hydrolase/transferase [Thermoanaerobaculia bacterium]|nr:sulfatase-like hydrolase/transferase [Thermoanaerobaculia bacterium]